MANQMLTIGDIAEIFDGPHATPKKIENGPYFLSISSLEDGRLDLSKSAHLSEEQFVKWTKRVTPQKGDLLFSYETRLGEAALMPEGVRACLGRRMGLLRPKLDKVIPEYLLYAYISPFFQQVIKANTIVGATVDRIALSEMKGFPIRIPNLSEQKAACLLLSTIDKKIELNNRINSELEAMAKTLYDYWFVQFDFPDANGKPYKASGGKMVYNPVLKREIPEGWVAKPLSKITSVSKQTVKPTDYPDKVFRHFSIPVYDATKTYGLEAGGTIGSNKFTNKESDILVSKLNPWFSRVIYAMEEKELICSTEFVVWRTSSSGIKNYLYMVAQSPQFITHCTQAATGTSNSHKRVNPSVMMGFELPFNDDVAISLGEKLEPMIKQKIINQRENTELAKLRDWLLPMLMNGQVTVKPSSESEKA
ncbi:restriction endonuclease subunit S [Vibrio parahaemolyticus]|uniref:restriction endonuclease subunit S n=1 Tax=Vibrio parahaemolyticus TaxID=670 RepID=UPI001121FCCF|nr:restriction endonuclease subunit S [Vibrio parahaemolyticus]ELA8131999.1 restriction endonuclease subunit S [Vibrio parahaemolyticus]ELA8133237.1 restriction endonuclease subunit S [Vibrio parahaemolyticus]TOK51439.1 restriction endonuclease subunit S [Vibrio parahaemolyticus]TOK79080.1 restriction endonuclease subunit S [Vibrio parahaemolyticus]TOK85952.1 restriction endonuclease subunit S [Vibrio parahaemolyticus]